ncbi:MAG TPA: hypothetical protein ACFCUY_06470, partial [Xenococcaceae cyanobacterium]
SRDRSFHSYFTVLTRRSMMSGFLLYYNNSRNTHKSDRSFLLTSYSINLGCSSREHIQSRF